MTTLTRTVTPQDVVRVDALIARVIALRKAALYLYSCLNEAVETNLSETRRLTENAAGKMGGDALSRKGQIRLEMAALRLELRHELWADELLSIRQALADLTQAFAEFDCESDISGLLDACSDP